MTVAAFVDVTKPTIFKKEHFSSKVCAAYFCNYSEKDCDIFPCAEQQCKSLQIFYFKCLYYPTISFICHVNNLYVCGFRCQTSFIKFGFTSANFWIFMLIEPRFFIKRRYYATLPYNCYVNKLYVCGFRGTNIFLLNLVLPALIFELIFLSVNG